ncbi:MAG: prepilin-type N-terminal cleavage/methylation domain-containing protein [Planctomycetes bacterium]|nr:prepilin-type N-terminal cleavage/methylation domain-containing protein [Planctomycetota bacterium]
MRGRNDKVWPGLSLRSPGCAARRGFAKPQPRPHRLAVRQGFTLIEMLVAMTLTIFVMVILSQCFILGLETFSNLKTIGDMQEKLRTATNLLRNDLIQDHFEAKRRLTDADIFTTRPREGFFKVSQLYASGVDGLDADNLYSLNASTDALLAARNNGHVLNFTNKQRGNRREKFYTALCRLNLLGVQTNYFNQSSDSLFQDQAGTYTSPWAEIAYFVIKTGSTVEPLNPLSNIGTPIYALYRSQYLITPDNTAVNNVSPPFPDTVNDAGGVAFGSYENIACTYLASDATKLYFSNPADAAEAPPVLGTPGVQFKRTFESRLYGVLTNPAPRAPLDLTSLTQADTRILGASLVLTDVLSFQVQVITGPVNYQGTNYLGTNDPTYPGYPGVDGNKENFVDPIKFKYQTIAPAVAPAGLGFDSSTSNAFYSDAPAVPTTTFSQKVIGLKITIRLWDGGTRQVRQVTIIQDL